MTRDPRAGDDARGQAKVSDQTRCAWVGEQPIYRAYHDEEWGVPSYDDRYLFEMLCLEGAQAGLSWITILNKREGYRRAFHDFDRVAVAAMSDDELEAQRGNAEIVRNRLKIWSVRGNAQAAIAMAEAHGSFSAYLWSLVGGEPTVNAWRSTAEVPASTPRSDALSRQLKRDGFKFVGTTICYAFMQAVGMVNDHTTDCFRYRASSSPVGSEN